jgi:hypothetical protein
VAGPWAGGKATSRGLVVTTHDLVELLAGHLAEPGRRRTRWTWHRACARLSSAS